MAWQYFCDLTIHTLDDASLLTNTVAAFHWHATFMAKYSKAFEWSGHLRYYFSVAAARSKHGFIRRLWYREKDQITFDAVVRPLLSRAPRHCRSPPVGSALQSALFRWTVILE